MIDDATKRAVEAIAAETERWCERAAGMSEGHRVWRSDSRREGGGAEPYLIVHDFQILPPGAPPPGSGTIFGPWPTPNPQ